MTEPHITRIEPLRPRGLKVRVHLDSGDPFEVVLEAIERNRLGVGDTLSASRRRRLLEDDADLRVRDAALNLLSYRARTHQELRRRLRQKGFDHERIDPCLERLREKGFIDDEAVAAAFVRDRLRHRPRGSAALSSELRAKGVDGATAGRTIERVFAAEETDDATLAVAAAEGWVRRQPDATLHALARHADRGERDRARRRLTGYLSRRGFRGAALRTGIEHAEALATGGDPA